MRLALIVGCVALLAGCEEGGSNSRHFPFNPARPEPVAPLPPCSTCVVAHASGVVIDSISHQPLAGASIEWTLEQDDYWRAGGMTDSTGAYSINIQVAPGVDYVSMHASKAGYVPRSANWVKLSTEMTVNFDLASESSANGSVTLVAINPSRPMCDEVSQQLNKTVPFWLTTTEQGTSVTLRVSRTFLEGGEPLDEPLETFSGSRTGNQVTAADTGKDGLFACPSDQHVSYFQGGTLNATVSGHEMSGQFTKTYGGHGVEQVTFVFQFQAKI